MCEQAIASAHLVTVLGEPPTAEAARQLWCELARRIESYRDRHPEAVGHETVGGVVAAIGPRPVERWVPNPEWDELAAQLRTGGELMAVVAEVGAAGISSPGNAASWAKVFDDAAALLEARRAPAVRERDRDGGMRIGC